MGIMMLMMLAAALPAARAYNFVSGGIYYDITGGSPNTVAVTYATGSYNSYSGEVSIPSTVTYNGTHYTVTAIGNSAFRSCSGLTGVTIPNTVTSIGERAFLGCSGLTSVTIPNGVETIGAFAFSSTGLTSVTILNSVKSIGQGAFSDCFALTMVVFNADSCSTMVGDVWHEGYGSVFGNYSYPYSNNSINTLIIGNNVQIIPDFAFADLKGIGTVNIPNSVTSIGSHAFSGCANLTSVNIPNSVTSIGDLAFSKCINIASFNVASENPVYDSRNNCNAIILTATNTLLYGCQNTAIPNTVVTIGDYAFSECSLSSTPVFPNSVQHIGQYAYFQCAGLTGTLTITNNIKTIGTNAFSGCYGLTSVVIGKAVDSIGGGAFSCDLSSVVFNADSCSVMGHSAFGSNTNSIVSLTIGSNVRAIPDYAFCSLKSIASLNLPNSVKYIGNSAFSGCSGITGMLILPDSVMYIGNSAFSGCSGITATLTIPNSVTYIGGSAFNYCSISSLAFNADSCSSGYSPFRLCNNLESLTIGNTVRNIPYAVFEECDNVTGELLIPNSVMRIEERAFQSCTGFTGNLTLPSSLSYIGDYAFSGCTGFSGKLTVPDSVVTIGREAFRNIAGIDSLIIGKSVVSFGYNVFGGCSSLSYIAFNADSCTQMSQQFSNCDSLSTLIIGNNVKNIPERAFMGCTHLNGTLLIPDSVVNIGEKAFDDCSSFDTLVIGKAVKNISFSRNVSMTFRPFNGCSDLNCLIYNAENCNASELASEYFGFFPHMSSVTIGESVISIPNYAFTFTGITGTLVIPNSVENIGKQSFQGNSIDTLIIGTGVQHIDTGAFKSCYNLHHVAFNADSCITMGSGVFSNCTNVSSLSIGDNVKTIPPYAFYGLNQISGDLVIPDSVVKIGQSAFSGCSGYTSLLLGQSVDSIGGAAFRFCNNLSGSLFIPNAVEFIGSLAFEGCTSLTNLILGRSVDSIGPEAFHNCTALNSIYCYPVNAPAIRTYYTSHSFLGVSKYTQVHVPCGSEPSYQSTWTDVSNLSTASYFYNIYETLQPYLLTAIPADTLQGTVQVTTQGTCTEPAVIEATPKFFYVFDHWSDGSTDNPRTIELTQDTTLVAHFREYALNIIQPSDSTYGQVIVLQQPTADNPQAVVEMIADTSCYNFYSWITPANDWESIGNENPITITLTQDTTIRATVISSLHMEVSQQPQWYDHVCEGDTMTLTASGANAYLWTTYHWDGSEGRYVDDDTLGFNADLHLTEVGSYHLRITGTDTSGCKGWYNVQQVHVFPNPDFTISGSTEFCAGDSTSLSIEFAPPATITLLSEDFSNGLSEDWTIANHYLEISTIESSTHGNAVLFPCYDLSSNETDELLLPEMDLSGRPTAILKFDVAYRQYDYENDQLKLLYSTDNGATWYTLYSKSGSNLATLGHSSNYFTPNDLQWRTDSIILTETWNYTNVFIKFVFTSRYGNNLWIDNIRILSSDAPINGDYMQYTWNNGATSQQQTIESTGVYRVTVSDYYACSSNDSVTVTVWQPDTTELTVTAEHSPYTLNGETFCTSGDYTQTLQNIHGCDSIVSLHLTVPTDTTFVYDTVCAGERAFGQSIMSPGEYQQTLAMLESQFGDSIPYELTYDTNTHIVSVKALTVYISEYWQSGVEEDYGGWLNPTYDYYDTTIYLNYNVWKDSSYYNFTYTLTYPSSLGCDSTVTKHLTAKFSDASYWLVTACGSYVWNGDTIVSSGEYYHSFTNVNGCDSTETLYLTVLPSVSEELSATACDSYTWNGVTYTESGDYTLNSDTTWAIVRNLYINNWGEWGYDDANGSFIYFHPSGWSYLQAHEDYDSETGNYSYYYYYTDQYGAEHLYNLGDIVPYIDTVPGCKSATLHLAINPSVTNLVEATACDSYTWNDSTYSTSGEYIQTFTAANGCDSVVTLHLTIHPSVAELVEATACDSYTWNGSTYTASGDYTQTFTSASGCDSVVTLHLTILPSPTPAITGVTTVCEGQTATLTATGGVSYLWEDGTATASFSTTESGVYTVTVTNANGCSATASATVTVNPLPEVAVTGNTYICPGGSTVLTATGAATYMWSNGSTNAAIPVNAFGQYSVIGTSAEGCFSTASVTVLVSQPPVITISGNTNLCTGESTTLTATGGVSYMWSNGSADSAITVNTAGNWQVIGYNENNCSNMASVTVNVWQPATTDLYITSFDSCYMWFGTPRCESGDYTHTLQTIHGCDSVITLHLTLEDAIVTEFSATACDSYTWNGATYSQSGNYTQSFTAVNGNDSIVTLHLTVNNPVHTAVTAESCGSYEWNGQTYTVSGDYTHEHLDANGCTQVDTLHLTIFNPVHTAVTAESCGSYEWNGQTYTVSGDYTHEHLDANGCTQVDTLHLTIFNPVHTAVTAESCGSYEWNGQTYTVSGDYTHEHLDANGCTQVDTLHLTVNDTQHIEFADSTCTAYVWNGQTYTASGDYTQTFAAANGCDSVVTLHLTIVPAITPVISVTGSLAACGDGSATLTVPGLYNSFAWSTGSTDPAITVSEAGFYWVTATDVYGCEGVSEMVQVGSSVQIEETPALCMVGVEDQHNLVVWEPLADSDVAEYRLYRENGQANIFEPLAVIPAGSGNAYADTTADPSVRAWRYKITAADTCGGETPMSALHKTVHLTINQGLGNSYNLIWTPYEGFEFASYRLYRGTANNNLQLIQTMPSTLTSFTDQNPAGDALFYQIEVVMDGNCVQETRDITFTGARSNIVYNGVPVATDVTVEACESYDWNGEVLTSSGEYTHSFNSVLGYDSVVTLHLTIHQPAASEFTVSCPDSCYTWNSTEYCASGDYTQTLQTVHGCDSVVTLHLTITVGIDDHDLAGSVKVFPNPANSMLNVQWAMGNEAATIELLDVTGKLLRTISATGETTSINVSSLADGMYFVRVTTEDGAVTKTFVVKR